MKYKYLTAAAMTAGEHLRSAHKDDPTYTWPDDDDVNNFVAAHVPVERRQRVAACLRAVNRGPVPAAKRSGGK